MPTLNQIEEADAIVAAQCIDTKERNYWLSFIVLRDEHIAGGYTFSAAVNAAMAEMDPPHNQPINPETMK